MKRAVFLFLSLMTIVTACDPDWALHPQNQGWAYIINKSESEITFRGYSLFTGSLYTECSIQPGDTACVSSSSWDERAPSWDKIEAAGWDSFLSTFAKRDFMINRDEFNEMHHVVSILTSPDDSVSWVLDVRAIEDDSIFNESNWEMEEFETDGYFKNFAWYYTFE